MKHVWSILSQSSSIDFEKNLLSLFNCVEEMSLVVDSNKFSEGKKIIIPAEFQLISFWTREGELKEEKLELKGEFVNPDGEVLSSFNNTITIKKEAPRFRNRTNIKGLPVNKEGRYYLKVWQKAKEEDFSLKAELPVDVKINYQIIKKNKQ
jgi:hypothetical protein